MKNLIYIFGGGFAFLLFPLLNCGHNATATTRDLAAQISGVYKVHHLQVFDEMIDTSKDFIGIVTITKKDASHIKLGMDIRHSKDASTPIETLCTLRAAQNKTQLIDVKTGEVLGYVENKEVHLNSSDSKGAKTEIVGKQL